MRIPKDDQEQKKGSSHVISLFYEIGGGNFIEYTNGLELSMHKASWGFHGASTWSFNFHGAIRAFPPSWSWIRHRCTMGRWPDWIDRKEGRVTMQGWQTFRITYPYLSRCLAPSYWFHNKWVLK